jgi:hypothetical protein
VVKGRKGQIRGFVEFTKGPRSFLTNPALLAGAAGIMAQIAMQQAMDEITDYLAPIDEKVDDVLRAQKDGVLARMIGRSPDELDAHRLGLRAARHNRLEDISRSTENLVARMNAAAGTANTKVLLHPTKSPAEHAACAQPGSPKKKSPEQGPSHLTRA